MEASEILVLHSLRDLDLTVAQKCLGWQNLKLIPYAKPYIGTTVNWQEWVGITNNNESLPIPYYSTQIADAWEIVEKLGLALIPQSRNDKKWNWFACDIESVFYSDSIRIYEKEDSGVSATTAPIAICLAALAAQQVVVELKLRELDSD